MKIREYFILALIAMAGFANAQTDTLSFRGALDKALENNYGIVTTKKGVEISELNNSWGNAGALPTISFVGSAAANANYMDVDNYNSRNLKGTVDVNWVIFRGFSAKIQKSKLEEFQNMSEGNLAITVENTIVEVILAYYNVLLEQKKVEIANENMLLSQDRYDREERKRNIGNSVTYDLLQAQNAFLEDTADYMMANTSLNNAVRQLNYLMVEPVESKYIFSSSFEAESADFEYSDLLDKMKSNNNTLHNQYINLELAKLDVRNAKSGYYPTLSAGVSGGYSNSEMDYSSLDNLDNTNSGYSVGGNLALSYQIYEGGTRKSALKVARIEEEITQVETKDMEQALENQLAQEFELYEVRKKLMNLAAENLKAAELNFNLSKQKFESGAINSFNYRDVQNLYLNSAWSKQKAIFNLIQSYHTLMRLTGGIIEEFSS